MFALLISVLIIGWAAATVIGTQAYYFGEKSKPIHERNWNSEGFAQIARIVTGSGVDFRERVPVYSGDAYSSRSMRR